MAGMNDSGQWLVILGFIVSISLLVLGIIANNSMLVGQTNAESILDFPKSEILGTQHAVIQNLTLENNNPEYFEHLHAIALNRMNTIIGVTYDPSYVTIHFNDGMVEYNSKVSRP